MKSILKTIFHLFSFPFLLWLLEKFKLSSWLAFLFDSPDLDHASTSYGPLPITINKILLVHSNIICVF